jgi:hypothetical protein
MSNIDPQVMMYGSIGTILIISSIAVGSGWIGLGVAMAGGFCWLIAWAAMMGDNGPQGRGN